MAVGVDVDTSKHLQAGRDAEANEFKLAGDARIEALSLQRNDRIVSGGGIINFGGVLEPFMAGARANGGFGGVGSGIFDTGGADGSSAGFRIGEVSGNFNAGTLAIIGAAAIGAFLFFRRRK